MADTKQLRVLIEAQDKTAAAFGQLDKSLNGLRDTARNVAAAVGSAFAFKDVLDSTRRMGQEIDTLMDQLGGSAEEMSKLAFISKSVGLPVDDLSNAFAQLDKKIADGSDVFKKWNVEVTDANGNIKPLGDIVRSVSERFRELGPGAARTAASMDLFGRSGRQLLDFLSLTDDEIKGFIRSAEDMGLVLDGKGVDALDAFNRQMYFLGLRFDSIKLAIGQALLPVISALVNGLQKASGAIKAFGQALQAPLGILKAVIDRMRAFVNQVQTEGVLAALITLARDVMSEIGKVLGNVGQWISDNFPRWRAALGQLFDGMLQWISSTGWPAIVGFFTNAIPEFAQWILDAIPVWRTNFGALLADFSDWAVSDFAPAVLAGLNEAIPAFSKWLGGALEWWATKALPELLKISQTIGTSIVKGIVDGLRDKWPDLITAWIQLVSNIPGFGLIRDVMGALGGATVGGGSGGGGGSFGGSGGTTPHLFAEGGIVRRPTLGIVGEAGPEAVIPLGRGGGMAGTTFINVTVEGSVLTEHDLAGKLSDVFLRQLQSQRNLNY